jgi:hypothetical protein
VVRQAIVWAGLPDPCLGRTRLAEHSDTAKEGLAQLIEAWKAFDPERRGLIVSKMINQLYSSPQDFGPDEQACRAMQAALENLAGTVNGIAPEIRKLGNRLRTLRRHVVDGFYIDRDESSGRDGTRWLLKEVKRDGHV